jgi:hypothetical protein
MKSLALIFIALISVTAVYAQSQADWAAMNKRVEDLEKQQSDFLFQTEERESKVNSFLKTNLTLGGFFEPAFEVIDGEDTHLQATNSSNLLGLNIAAEFTPQFKFVSQAITGLTFPLQNRHNDPRGPTVGLPVSREFKGASFGAVLTQGYVNYTFDENYTLLFGIGYVPFGYYAQQREPVLFIRRAGPQILRTSDLFSPLWNGFNLQTRFDKGSSSWGYNFYSFNRLEDVKRPGLGARTWWQTPDDAFTAGLSYQTAKFNSEMENIVGADFRAVLNHFIFTTEYIRHVKDGADVWSYYFEPSIFVYNEDTLFYVFFDYANNPSNRTGASTTKLDDPVTIIEQGAGINWLPTSYTRFRVGFTYHNYVNEVQATSSERDYYTVDLSAGVAF